MTTTPPAPELVTRLVCPLTKGPVHYDAARNCIISPKAKLAFPVRDGIPVMLPEHATPLEEN
ncbi:Trm112 family protein [Bombella saccharophila]|uniref:Trm112 family protein n=1 Tax=Bombella saccharophila TaxID=2967338 RepID=A0ABT3W8L6_9PROT|nr:Trm112 family protein [Bombella saccharophila]MCX5615256.1 Trm112 family protein [Bombella saccharophila]